MDNKIEQSGVLVDRCHDVLRRYYDTVTFNGVMASSSFECNHVMLYSYIYGHSPLRQFFMYRRTSDGSNFFTDYSIGSNSVIGPHSSLDMNLSFHDTCYKLCVEVYAADHIGIWLCDRGIIFLYSSSDWINGDVHMRSLRKVCICCDSAEDGMLLGDFVSKHLVRVIVDDKAKTSYIWINCNQYGGLNSTPLKFDSIDVDIDKNYNNNIPYDRIVGLLNSKNKELLMFDGKPGTGKTTLIKHLMGLFEKPFYYFDSSILNGVNPSEFVNFMIDHRNSVFVLEDCEKILLRREEGNPFMGTLLNLTDGILGDTICPKFICSFNCSEDKIDDALLRKGRLSLKYTFKELSLKKTMALLPEANRPMTLAEIYGANSENLYGVESKKKVGFF